LFGPEVAIGAGSTTRKNYGIGKSEKQQFALLTRSRMNVDRLLIV
jgi:hypothetical protein